MFNLYSIIVGLFAIAGAVVALWSWQNIRKNRLTKSWSEIQARITEASKPSKETEFLPKVIYSYSVSGQQYHKQIEIPSGESSMPDFTEHFLKKYPVGMELTTYYNPDKPEVSTLRIGVNREDWLIFAVGVGAMLLGLIFFIVNI